jgi:hypothetical protein
VSLILSNIFGAFPCLKTLKEGGLQTLNTNNFHGTVKFIHVNVDLDIFVLIQKLGYIHIKIYFWNRNRDKFKCYELLIS